MKTQPVWEWEFIPLNEWSSRLVLTHGGLYFSYDIQVTEDMEHPFQFFNTVWWCAYYMTRSLEEEIN